MPVWVCVNFIYFHELRGDKGIIEAINFERLSIVSLSSVFVSRAQPILWKGLHNLYVKFLVKRQFCVRHWETFFVKLWGEWGKKYS